MKPPSIRDALAMVPDGLIEGAFIAIAHDIPGLEHGEGFSAIDCDEREQVEPHEAPRAHLWQPHNRRSRSLHARKPWACRDCLRRFRSERSALQHWTDRHGERG